MARPKFPKIDIMMPYIPTPYMPTGEEHKKKYRVENNSKMIYRKAVEKLAKYFSYETKDGGMFGFDARYYAHDFVAYLWVDRSYIVNESSPCVGICFFEEEVKIVNDKAVKVTDSWELRWLWFHPFYRGDGLLAKEWDTLKEELGDFGLQPPISKSMQGFLEKLAKNNKDGSRKNSYGDHIKKEYERMYGKLPKHEVKIEEVT